MVESQPSKLLVAGSIPVSRSNRPHTEPTTDCGNHPTNRYPISSFVLGIPALIPLPHGRSVKSYDGEMYGEL